MSKKVLVSGTFNILHPGHLRLLKFAKSQGDYLIVAVNSNKNANKSSYLDESHRFEALKSIGWINEVVILNARIEDLIFDLKPNIIVKGREYESRFNPEVDVLNTYGGKLIFSSGESYFSSLDLLNSELRYQNHIDLKLFRQFTDRHNINEIALVNLIKKFKDIRVCVIGDLIVDEYINCQALGMSQEDPAIVAAPVSYEKFIGGAAIVASHAAGLGAKTTFISVVGADAANDFSQNKLLEYGVNFDLHQEEGRPTTLKQRFRSKGKNLFRLNHVHQSAIPIFIQEKIISTLRQNIENFDLVVLSDFNYGALPQELVDKIIKLCKEKNILIVADSQSSSQIGDVARFGDVDLLTPTEWEARLSTKNMDDGLIVLVEKLKEISGAKNIFLKLGEDGLIVHSQLSVHPELWETDQIEALNRYPVDVAGAGDSMLITAALTLASGADIWSAACLGSLAAAIQVGRVGNTPITHRELMEVIG